MLSFHDEASLTSHSKTVRQLASVCKLFGVLNRSLKGRGLMLCPKLNLEYTLLSLFIGYPSGNDSVPLLTSSVNVTGKL